MGALRAVRKPKNAEGRMRRGDRGARALTLASINFWY